MAHITSVGVPQLTSFYMDVYFTIYNFYDLLLIPWNFFSSRASTTKNGIYDILTFDPLITTYIPTGLVPKIPQNAIGHSKRRSQINSLRPYMLHLRIVQRIFYHKITSL